MNETFARWCLLRGCRPLPAAPADIARFVDETASLGIEKLWPIVQDISRDHYAKGLADPTAGGLVAAAINRITMIDPPRSWPKEQKRRFLQLPYDLQAYVSEHERRRETSLRQAQTALDKERKANGIQSQDVAA